MFFRIQDKKEEKNVSIHRFEEPMTTPARDMYVSGNDIIRDDGKVVLCIISYLYEFACA